MAVLEVLLIVFIVLKLLGVIAWTWPMVLFPLWLIIGFVILITAAGVTISK